MKSMYKKGKMIDEVRLWQRKTGNNLRDSISIIQGNNIKWEKK